MFLPDNLSPLPVTPCEAATAGNGAECIEDFVRAGDVRKVLLGEPPAEGLSAVDLDSFAGRSDVSWPSSARRAVVSETPLVVPVLVPEPRLVHPAFEALPPVRRAAPPLARSVGECEASFGSPKISDRWWVIGMGISAAAILFSGAAVDFISREAVRRSRAGVEPVYQVIRSVPEVQTPSEENRSEEIAASLRPDGKR